MTDQPIPTEDTEAHIRMGFAADAPVDTDDEDTEAHVLRRFDDDADGVQPKWE